MELEPQEALVEDRGREELVQRGAAGRPDGLLEVGLVQSTTKERARDHTSLRRRRPLGLNGVVVPNDEQDRARSERERDARRDGEPKDQARRLVPAGGGPRADSA